MNRWLLVLNLSCSTQTLKDSVDVSVDSSSATDTSEDGNAVDTSDSGLRPGLDTCIEPTNPSPLAEKNCVRQAACLWNGEQYYGNFGHTIDIGGDIDGDGQMDWVVGAPYEDDMAGDEVRQLDVGRAHIFLGGNRTTDAQFRLHLTGTDAASSLGYAAVIAPDLNGDGFDDVVAGGRGTHTDSTMAAGEVQVLLGKEGGWDSDTPSPDIIWFGEQEMARAGSTIAGLGDLNGDGMGELAVATNQRQTSASGSEQPGQGAVALFYGTEDFTRYETLGSASALVVGVGPSDSAGSAIASGDLNGDGYMDLIVGAPKGSSNRGHVVIFPGSAAAMEGTSDLGTAPIQFHGREYSDNFGFTVASGDLNADGTDELVIGAPTADDNAPEAGTVFVYSGASTFFEAAVDAAHQFTGEWDDHQLGSGLQAGIDLDNDGIGDLMMGAVGAWQGLITKGGRTYIFHGPTTDWNPSQSAARASLQFFGAETKDYLGRSMDAADINSDGKTDLMLGSSFTNDGENFDAGSVYLFWGD